MYSTEPQEIFLQGTHGVGMQDKKPPGRLLGGLSEPVTAATDPVSAKDLPENRQKHHGSENRQTALIAGRVPLHIKTEVNRIGAVKNWTESYTVRTLVEQALAQNLGEKFAVMIRNTIQEAVKTEIQSYRNLTVKSYYAAEETRILQIRVLSLLLDDIEEIPELIAHSQKQARENLRYAGGGEQEHHSLWPSSS